jgi:WD40 repeat protein
VAVTSDCQKAVSGSRDKTLKVWDLESGHELATLTGHTDPVRSVAVTPDNCRIVSISDRSTIKVWNLGDYKELYTFEGYANGVWRWEVIPDGLMAIGHMAITGSKTIKICNIERGAIITEFSCDWPLFKCRFCDILGTYIAWDVIGGLHIFRLEGITSG